MTHDDTTVQDEAARADEVTISVVGRSSKDVPIWIVRSGDELYVRSYRGPAGRWYRDVLAAGEARLGVGGRQVDVRAEPVADASRDDIDDAYRRKYGHYRPAYIDPMTSDEVVSTTLRLVPAGT